MTASARQHWSLARRFLWISLAVVLGHSVVSLVITTGLREHLMNNLLRGTMQRQSLAMRGVITITMA